MDQQNSSSDFDKSIDKVLLKLSKEYGIALPKDDPILIQLYLNKEIFTQTVNESMSKLIEENKLTVQYFRKALSSLAKDYNENLENQKKKAESDLIEINSFKSSMRRIVIILSVTSIASLMASLIMFYLNIHKG
ncbi:hypothetical protein [Paraglaciecola sp. 20A4]|uniref:hypothetical protein n=1 Tax=Paraglaciecola sp. 20A4 TaxID=2687288 RepID=UPI0014073FB1|nr:hypothetical protein [Paraglaciecola sp. 20A4]